MVGRRMTGQPLVPGARQISGVDSSDMALNGFTFDADDKDGLQFAWRSAYTALPIHAHGRYLPGRPAKPDLLRHDHAICLE